MAFSYLLVIVYTMSEFDKEPEGADDGDDNEPAVVSFV